MFKHKYTKSDLFRKIPLLQRYKMMKVLKTQLQLLLAFSTEVSHHQRCRVLFLCIQNLLVNIVKVVNNIGKSCLLIIVKIQSSYSELKERFSKLADDSVKLYQ